MSSGFTEALARRDRLVSEANLRVREVTKRLTTEFDVEVDDAKNSLQFKLRQTEDKYTHRLARLKRQLEDRETAIDTEAHSSGSSATSKIESEEWVAEGKYEQTITLAKKELRTSVGMFAEIDSISESLKQLLPSKMTSSKNLDEKAEDLDLAVILEELKEISSFHAGSSWAKPWKLPIEKLRRSRRANRDGQRVMFLREVARRLLAEAEETHQRICDEASELLNLKVNRAKEHISPSIEVVEKRKNRRHEKLEISYEKKVGMAREMHEKDRDDIELESRNLMEQLRTRYEQAIEKLNDETESQIAETTKTFNETTGELAINWKDETDRFKNELELLSGIRDVSPLDWNNSTWQDWSDENDASFIATIGEIDIDIDELFQPVLELTDLEWDGPEKATLPLSAHLPHDVSIMFEYRADNRDDADLFKKVAVIDHAGQFHNALQLNFTPAAADVRFTQRLHQIGCFLAELLMSFAERLNLRLEFRITLDPRLFHRAQFVIDRLERFLHRLEQVVDSRLPLFQFARGLPLL